MDYILDRFQFFLGGSVVVEGKVSLPFLVGGGVLESEKGKGLESETRTYARRTQSR